LLRVKSSFVTRHRPRSTLFPYTTLFRSGGAEKRELGGAQRQRDDAAGSFGLRQNDASALHRRAGDAGFWHHRHRRHGGLQHGGRDRKSTRVNSSHVKISYAVFCLKNKTL